MANVTPDKITKLANRYEEACKHLKAAVPSSSGSDSDFLQIIHRGGWTTLIDVEHATAIVDAFEQQAKAINATHKALVDGARNALTKSASA